MRRGRAIGIGGAAAAAAVAVITGAAFGVSGLTQEADHVSRTVAQSTPTPSATPSASADRESAPSHSPASPEPAPSAEPAPSTAPAPPLTERPSPPAILAPGDQGPQVRELQSRLDQIAWYEPDITGEYDEVTRAAVEGFQAKRGFEVTGEVDQRTWDRVLAMTRMPTDAEMHNRLVPGPTILGPGDSGRDVRELQARLKQIAWFNHEVTDYYGDVTTGAVAGFQTKREIPSTGEVDQRTMDRLLAMTTEPTKQEMSGEPEPAPEAVVAPLDPRCQTGEVLCIDKTSRSLRWVVDGEVQMTVDVRFGREETPTREGEFSVNFKSRDHVSSIFNTSMPYAMFFSGGQAVHYSPDFAANGYNGASHGCVNVRDLDAIKSLFAQVDVNDTVIVYRS
ncbi:MAG TPA: L,D-transpeptidase family protein [Nocardioidaceae bacterium]|nr:L,D-transpeptidase family protein [Nocardioidaceae bacterium]